MEEPGFCTEPANCLELRRGLREALDAVDATPGHIASADVGISADCCHAGTPDFDVVVVMGVVVARRHAAREDVDHVAERIILVPVDLLAFPVGVSAILVVHCAP